MKIHFIKFLLPLFFLLTPRVFPAVQTGLDNIDSYRILFKGKRIGIITNQTACDKDGKHILDVIVSRMNARVTALFSPEHGIKGKEVAGKGISHGFDPKYKIPVYSLYCNGRPFKPTPRMLKKVDILVFDIQDIGARFYTYIWSMALAMKGAAEQEKTFVVLDRPNPINGEKVEGNILEPEFSSPVGLYPVPVRHGMTIGELARMFNEEGWLKVKADLKVIPMKGWKRTFWYDQTNLKFIKPSPNIIDLETAVVYPGLCLLEGINVSEGRGTDKPFKQFGAPWINASQLVETLNSLALPGVRFTKCSFKPKHKTAVFNGAQIQVTDRNVFQPYRTGIGIVDTIYRLYPARFQWNARHFDYLCGSSTVREAIIKGKSLDKLRSDWQVQLERFKKKRKKYLLY